MGRMSLRWRKAFTTVRHTFGKVRLALIGDEQLIKIHSQNFVCYSWEEEFLFVSDLSSWCATWIACSRSFSRTKVLVDLQQIVPDSHHSFGRKVAEVIRLKFKQ